MNIRILRTNKEKGSLILQLMHDGEPCPDSVIGIKQIPADKNDIPDVHVAKSDREGKVEIFLYPETSKITFFFLDDPGRGWGNAIFIQPRYQTSIINSIVEI